MDRLPRPFVAFGLGLLLAGSGCRSTRNEVPPGRPFAKDGQQRKAIEFSSDGHPVSAAASANFMPSNLGGSDIASGIGANGARPDGSAMGGPSGLYGPPGSAGLDQPGMSDSSITKASGGPMGTPPPGVPPLETLPSSSSPGPSPDVAPMPSQTVIPPTEAPGTMGSPNAPPSPM